MVMHTCDVCLKEWRSLSQLERHMYTHTGEKPFMCDQCPHKCNQLVDIIKHKRTHTGEKPFMCDQCPYECTESGSLVKHKRTHTGERPYKCDMCPFECITSGNLAHHMYTHTGEKPWKCDQCPYECVQRGSLVTHMRTHTGERPYKCNECPYESAQSGNLVNHKRTYHTEEGQRERKREEVKVQRLLDAEFGADFYKREHQIDYRCLAEGTFSRLDFLLPSVNGCHVFLEVDEQAHAFYSQTCETARMNNIAASLRLEGNTMPMVFIRYNPHAFKVDGKTVRTKTRDRHAALVAMINSIAPDPERPIRIYYMFYDTDDGVPCVMQDTGYFAEVKNWFST
jgi:general transcription factor IIIA